MYLVLYYKDPWGEGSSLHMQSFKDEQEAVYFAQKKSGYIVKALQIKSTIEEEN